MLSTSIVIATNGRANALHQTLQALQYQEYPSFEVIVVKGPTKDGTDEVVAAWGDSIKVVSNPELNLSRSRNLGIAESAGDLVAFIDDDGVPEPEWLEQIVSAFNAPKVAGAGGLVMDHTGWNAQYRYASADRLGNSDWARQTPADHFNFPYSFNFPYLQGTNSAFRRSFLAAIGGFDEEYEFYLDETDLCCRMVDQGWTLRQLPNAVVHHKFLPSSIRDNNRVTRKHYAVLKNKLYFSLINNQGHFSTHRAMEDMIRFEHKIRQDIQFHIDHGRLDYADMELFEEELARAWNEGLKRGLSGERRTVSFDEQAKAPAFRSFSRRVPELGRKHYVLVTAEYPPDRSGGIGRSFQNLAQGMAATGHHVRVITHTDGHARCDFEDGVWVDRIPPLSRRSRPKDLSDFPDRVWNRAAAVCDRLDELDRCRAVSVVYAPIWDGEGIAVLRQNTLPLVIGLQTTLRFWLEGQTEFLNNKDFMKNHATPMLAVEKELMANAAGLHANSRALLDKILPAYNLNEEDLFSRVIPLGLADWSESPAVLPPALPKGSLRLLFVGRLELRKGIDILLSVLPDLLKRYSNVYVDIVGNDRITSPQGPTFRELFEASNLPGDVMNRVRFHGEVEDVALRGFYASCDVLMMPSRFESFGLALVEGMMFGKPVVGCASGGMVEIVEDGLSGRLARPGDSESLLTVLEELVSDDELRTRLGRSARSRYLSRFSEHAMAQSVEIFLRESEARWKSERRQEAWQ